jgi:FkbM family methyltransferase
MSKEITLPMVDGVLVVVPDSLELITPYVLQEQLDWFEPEIKFLRRALKTGQRVIDIGANYGVFTLSMAHAVGATGKVWAFEPANSTANILAKSIAANCFEHVDLQRCALSNQIGTTQFMVGQHAELNSIVRRDRGQAGTLETVKVGTLDERMSALAWNDIDFIKIDAEGEEFYILDGGKMFFAKNSPLVQFEVKIEGAADLTLIPTFAAMGYDVFQLVAGLDVLVPFSADTKPDSYLLNMFACKPDRAAVLEQQGKLVTRFALKQKENQEEAVLEIARANSAYAWRNAIATLPYALSLASQWEHSMSAQANLELVDALALHAMSRDMMVPPVQRLVALMSSLARFTRIIQSKPTYCHRASYVRIASEAGQRENALNVLDQMLQKAHQEKQFDLTEPFLPPCERFDRLNLGAQLNHWPMCAMHEQYEWMCSHSSFYVTEQTIGRLQYIQQLGFLGQDMQRRLNVARRRLVK